MNQATLRPLRRRRIRIWAWDRQGMEQNMTYEQPHYEIESSVIALGIVYAVSLISLILWVAC